LNPLPIVGLSDGRLTTRQPRLDRSDCVKTYLNVFDWKYADGSMAFPFNPILIDLSKYVDHVSLVKRQFSEHQITFKQTLQSSKIHEYDVYCELYEIK